MTRRDVLRHTICGGFSLLVFGMSIGQKISSVDDLIMISRTDMAGGSIYLMAANAGYLFGSIIAGISYDMVKSKSLVIAMTMLVAGILDLITPWMHSFASMLIVLTVRTIWWSFCFTYIETLNVTIWEGESGPGLVFMGFCYSLGGFFGPLYTEPFLAPKTNHTANGNLMDNCTNASFSTTDDRLGGVEINYDKTLFSNGTFLNTRVVDSTFNYSIAHDVNAHGNASSTPCHHHGDSQLFWSYLITAVLMTIAAVPFVVLWCKSWNKKTCAKYSVVSINYNLQESKEMSAEKPITEADKALGMNKPDENEDCGNERPRKVYFLIMLICSVYCLLHTLAEDTFNQFIFLFVVKYLNWSKHHGAWITSLYWGVSTCSKLILIFIFKRFRLGPVLFISAIAMVCSCLLFTLSANFDVFYLVWISTGLFGLFQAPIYSGIVAWSDAELMKLNGKECGALLVAMSCGSIAGPFIISFLVKTISLFVFPCLVLAACVASCLTFSVLFLVVKPHVLRSYGPVRPLNKTDITTVFVCEEALTSFGADPKENRGEVD